MVMDDQDIRELKAILEKQYNRAFTESETKEIGSNLVNFYRLILTINKQDYLSGRPVMIKHQTTLTGAAGEHYVMYRLLRMGYIAALAPKGVPNADLIVTNVEGELTAVIQVKTMGKQKSNGGWQMKLKHENLKSKHLFYCFVDDAATAPVVYIIPSKIVAEVIATAHKIWFSTIGKNGRAHKENDIRWLLPDYRKTLRGDNEFLKIYIEGWLDQYKENWEILNLKDRQ